MRAGGTDPEYERKLKSVQDELKAKTKAVAGIEKSKKELAKKLQEEVLGRAKAEADAAMYGKMVDILQDKTGSVDKSNILLFAETSVSLVAAQGLVSVNYYTLLGPKTTKKPTATTG